MIEKPLIDILWVVLSAGLVLLMQAGFLCLEASMTRSKNSINVAIKNLADFGIAVVLFWAFGFALMFGTTKGGWIGWSQFFTPVGQDRAWLATFFLFQVIFCGTAVTIISGVVAERARFAGYIIVSALVSGLIYPIFGHWVWGGNFEGAFPAGLAPLRLAEPARLSEDQHDLLKIYRSAEEHDRKRLLRIMEAATGYEVHRGGAG